MVIFQVFVFAVLRKCVTDQFYSLREKNMKVTLTEIAKHNSFCVWKFGALHQGLGDIPKNLSGAPNSRTKGSLRPLLKISTENLSINTEHAQNCDRTRWVDHLTSKVSKDQLYLLDHTPSFFVVSTEKHTGNL